MTSTRAGASPVSAPDDESWVNDLTASGAAGAEAVRRLHDTLLRATRHQVWRLRGLLPGAGARDRAGRDGVAASEQRLAGKTRLRDRAEMLVHPGVGEGREVGARSVAVKQVPADAGPGRRRVFLAVLGREGGVRRFQQSQPNSHAKNGSR